MTNTIPSYDKTLLLNTLASFGGAKVTVDKLQAQLNAVLNQPVDNGTEIILMADGQVWSVEITKNSLLSRLFFGKAKYTIKMNKSAING